MTPPRNSRCWASCGGLVSLRKNLFLPTKKANGWRTTKSGRNSRTYDQGKTPDQRLHYETGFLTPPAQHQLQALHETTNPAELTRNINRTQQALIASAQGQNRRPAGAGFVSKIREARAPRSRAYGHEASSPTIGYGSRSARPPR